MQQVFDEDNDGEIDYREFIWSISPEGLEGKPRLADLWRAGGTGWVTAAVGSKVALHPTAKPYGCLAETHRDGSSCDEGEIVEVNTGEMNGKEMITFKVRCTRTGKISSYKSEMIQLLDEDDDIQQMLDAVEHTEDEEDGSLPGTPPQDGFTDLNALPDEADSPVQAAIWKCDKCGKMSSVSADKGKCTVCKGRLRPLEVS